MIVTVPDDAVPAPRIAHSNNESEDRETGNPQSRGPKSTQSTTNRGNGGALQTLLNVTIDCVRGRYDR